MVKTGLGLGMTNDPVISREEVLESVTNQVTTAPGNGRRSATPPDTEISPTCGNPTHCDAIRRNWHAW